MDNNDALEIFASLSQETRLETFRLLVKHAPEGLPAGDIARALQVPHNTLSSHLAILTRADLVEAERKSRSIIYRAKPETVQALAGYLLKDCCGGREEICAPLIADLQSCCGTGCTSSRKQ